MKRKINIIGLTLFFTLILFSLAFSEESMTITTYYPSPYGSYRELTWGDYPNTRGTLSVGEGSSIELGGGGVPYIDFSNDMTTDFDMRIMLTGNNSLLIDGGNVGIGTADPGTKLHVQDGTIRVAGAGSPATGGALCLNSSGNMSKCTSAVDASGNCACP